MSSNTLTIVFRFPGGPACAFCGETRLPKVHLSSLVVIEGEVVEVIEAVVHPDCAEDYKRARREAYLEEEKNGKDY